MKGKILHTTTPTARKEYTCQICGKPIGKGEKYQNIAYKEGGKLKNSKTHLECHEKPERKKNHTDVMDLQKTFTHMEQMKMSAVPLIITEVAWVYVMKVVKFAADNRIPETVKISRAVKMLRDEYLSACRKQLAKKDYDKILSVGEEFINENPTDFTLLYYTMNNDLKRHWYGYEFLDMRTDACVAVVMLQLLKEHNKRMNELMTSRLGTDVPTSDLPINDSLRECMEAYASPCAVEFNTNIRNAMSILNRKFNSINFDVK